MFYMKYKKPNKNNSQNIFLIFFDTHHINVSKIK